MLKTGFDKFRDIGFESSSVTVPRESQLPRGLTALPAKVRVLYSNSTINLEFITIYIHKLIAVSLIVLYCLYLYPGFYSYTEGATWKILAFKTGAPIEGDFCDREATFCLILQ